MACEAAREAEAVGVTASLRPDGRLVVRNDTAWTDDAATRATEIAKEHRAAAIVVVDAHDETGATVLQRVGFHAERREVVVEFSVERALELLPPKVPRGFAIRSATEVDVDRLRLLDDALRQDVPGTSGWRNSEDNFATETFGAPEFDAATYLVAVDDATRDEVGLIRIWMNASMPRFGMVGVRAQYRRHGIATALLRQALRAARDAGATTVTAEFDVSNVASNALADAAGAAEVKATVEFVYAP